MATIRRFVFLFAVSLSGAFRIDDDRLSTLTREMGNHTAWHTASSMDFCTAKLGALIDEGTWSFNEVPSMEEEPDPDLRTCSCDCVGSNAADCYECERGEIGGSADQPTCSIERACQNGEIEQPDGNCLKTTRELIPNPCGGFEPKGVLLMEDDGSFICEVSKACPAVAEGVRAVIEMAAGTCNCRYKVSCPPSEAGELSDSSIDRSTLVCTYKRIVPKPTPETKEATCKAGTTPKGNGVCTHPMPCPPGPVEISPTHLACGPKSKDYVQQMLLVLRDIASSVVGKPLQLSCKTTCVSVWAKLAECAGLASVDKSKDKADSWAACIGRGAIRGVQYVDFSSLMRADPTYDRFWKLKNRNDHLNCYSAFQSSVNFKGGEWAQLVDTMHDVAAETYVRLQGSYVEVPSRAISCRRGYCNAADKRGPSLSQCLESCAKSHPNK